jgi:hypothetical protein
MKIRFICIFALFLLFSGSSFAQTNPAWITSVEETLKKKETVWKIKNKIEYPDTGSYSFTLKSGNATALIQISAFPVITNPEETFTGQVTIFDNTAGKNMRKNKLPNFGNEGYIWTGSKGAYTTIKFRKGNVFVNVFAPTEKTARRFAQYVFEQIP